MTSNVQGSSMNPHCDDSFAPPAFLEYAYTSTITGTGIPGTVVKLTDGDGMSLGSAKVDANSSWSVELDKPTTQFSVLQATASDSSNGTSSAPAKVAVSYPMPEVTRAYSGIKGAIGSASPASRVVAYAHSGECIGFAFANSSDGSWVIKYVSPVNAGTKISIIAEANSFTAPPYLVTAKSFDIERSKTNGVRGSGAAAGSSVLLYDDETGQLIDEVAADSDGSWSFTFAKPMKAGKKVNLFTSSSTGLTSASVSLVLSAKNLIPPNITHFSEEGIAGTVQPGEMVYIEATDSCEGQLIQPDDLGYWTTEGILTFHADETVVATTVEEEAALNTVINKGTTDTSASSTVKVSQPIPQPPIILAPGPFGANGQAQPGTTVYAADSKGDEAILLGTAKVDSNGYWNMRYPYQLDDHEIIYFRAVANDDWNGGAAPGACSIYMVRFANDAANNPKVPTLDVYTGTTFSGGNGTSGAVVTLWEENGQQLGPLRGATPDRNGNWEMDNVTPAVPDGTMVAVMSAFIGPPGLTSALSTPYKKVDSYKPPAPDVVDPYPSYVAGIERIQEKDKDQVPLTTIYIGNRNSPYVPLTGVPGVDIDPVTLEFIFEGLNLNVGDKLYAWAETDAGVQSELTPFEIAGTQRPLPPQISQYGPSSVSGKVYSTGLEVTLFKNEEGTTPIGQKTLSDLYWDFEFDPPLEDNTTLIAVATGGSPTVDSVPYFETIGLGEPKQPYVRSIEVDRVVLDAPANSTTYVYHYDTGAEAGVATQGDTAGQLIVDLSANPLDKNGAAVVIVQDNETSSMSPIFIQVVGYTYP